ncbi:MAG: radical SAM family heme chaperone HemW [Anaerolineae bacterium]|nr:radical SAM family heme chaperone HemW [Anaerolineae bacterium]
MNSQGSRSLSLYLHIPFCKTRCSYCAFNTYTQFDHLVDRFVDALCEEIRLTGAGANGYQVHTIFFGGGTPSLLTHGQFERLFGALATSYTLLPDAEITIEANPNDLDRAYLAPLRRMGVNRLSIGMQSSSEMELRLFDRRHDNEAVVRAVDAARGAGFDNLNLDLIFGVPQQTMATWEASLRQMLALQPDHTSLYALSLEEGTSMHNWVERGKLPAPDDDLAADMYDLATDMLAAAGYGQYEISNWCKPGHECRHNLQYWYNEPYLGLGPGAHGFANGVRYSVIRSPQRYIAALLPQAEEHSAAAFPLTPAVDEAVTLERDDEIAETLIMWLRLTHEGVDRARFARRFGVDLVHLHRSLIDRFTHDGLLQVDETSVRLTDRGRMLSNVVFRELV